MSIMNERVQAHISNLKKMNWDFPTVVDIPDVNHPSVYMTLLVKETGMRVSHQKLHEGTLLKVLLKYLDLAATKNIMSEIFKIYVTRFDELYKALEIYSSAAKNR